MWGLRIRLEEVMHNYGKMLPVRFHRKSVPCSNDSAYYLASSVFSEIGL
jgi:hypothetical protein